MKKRTSDNDAFWATILDLLNHITKEFSPVEDYGELARHLDKFVLSSHCLDDPRIPPIESIDVEFSHPSEKTTRAKIAARFSKLGLYWTVLDPRMNSKQPAESAVGDAIDDLLDISKELNEVRLLLDQHGHDQALAGLKFRYQSHLWMHVFPLYLEEVIRMGFSD